MRVDKLQSLDVFSWLIISLIGILGMLFVGASLKGPDPPPTSLPAPESTFPPTPPPTPTPTSTPIETVITILPSEAAARKTDAPGPAESPSPTGSPPLPDTPMPTKSPSPPSPASPLHTPTPIESPSPIASPTSKSILGFVTAENLSLRSGPGPYDQYIAALHENDRLIILQSNMTEDWFNVKTVEGREGWVKAKFIEIEGEERPPRVFVTPTPVDSPTLRPRPALTPPPTPISIPPINPGDIVFGELTDQSGYEYPLAHVEKIRITLMFRPQVANVHFEIYSPKSAGGFDIVGSGSQPARDLDDNRETGELVWEGVTLQLEVGYSIHVINGSSSDIQYCLTALAVDKWSCD